MSTQPTTVDVSPGSSEDYEWDVFVSYPHEGPVGKWCEEVFCVELKAWLPMERQGARVFFAKGDVSPGSKWPESIAHALRHSRCMIPVLAPPYFGSDWCTSEWRTMRKREEVCGNITLIYPVRFSDGDYFPEDANARQHIIDLSKFTALRSDLSTTVRYMEFIEELQVFCGKLDKWIRDAPTWDPSWPTLAAPPVPKPVMPVPKW